MATARSLWTQRSRWQRGTLDDLWLYGWTRATRMAILRQAGIYASMFALVSCVSYTVTVAAVFGTVTFNPIWLAAGAVFLTERVIGVVRGGRAGIALAAVFIVEFAYDLFRYAVYTKSLFDALRRTARQWVPT